MGNWASRVTCIATLFDDGDILVVQLLNFHGFPETSVGCEAVVDAAVDLFIAHKTFPYIGDEPHLACTLQELAAVEEDTAVIIPTHYTRTLLVPLIGDIWSLVVGT